MDSIVYYICVPTIVILLVCLFTLYNRYSELKKQNTTLFELDKSNSNIIKVLEEINIENKSIHGAYEIIAEKASGFISQLDSLNKLYGANAITVLNYTKNLKVEDDRVYIDALEHTKFIKRYYAHKHKFDEQLRKFIIDKGKVAEVEKKIEEKATK